MLDTPTKILQAFDALSAETSISLPDLLRRLLATGQTRYGPEWATTWRERCLRVNPKQKLAAIQDYRQQFNVSLSEAMLAVNRYIEDVTKQS